ncbi:MAG: hypothetical protein ACRD1L_09360 [Terriglobales bacterium]
MTPPGPRSLSAGARATARHDDNCILAVVRGRLRVTVAPPAGPPSTDWLRSSDALPIPARAAYTMEAMEDTELYLFADLGASRELWGV